MLVHGRNRARVQRLLRELRAHTGNTQVFGYCYTLSSLQRRAGDGGITCSVDLAQHFNGRLHCLVNNAGLFNEELQLTEVRRVVGAATRRRLPLIKAAAASRTGSRKHGR